MLTESNSPGRNTHSSRQWAEKIHVLGIRLPGFRNLLTPRYVCFSKPWSGSNFLRLYSSFGMDRPLTSW